MFFVICFLVYMAMGMCILMLIQYAGIFDEIIDQAFEGKENQRGKELFKWLVIFAYPFIWGPIAIIGSMTNKR